MKILNKYNFNSVGIFLLVCVALFSFVVTASAAPHISCANTTYNFNVSNEISAVEHTFVLTNTGDEDLVFGQVRSCCGSKASLRDKVVAPGSNTTLNVKLSLRGRRGKVNKSIYVASNDPKHSYLQLKLTGIVSSTTSSVRTTTKSPSKSVVIGDILVVPKEICVTGGKNRKEPVVRYLALRSRKRAPFKIMEVKLMEGMTHTLTALGNAGWRIEIANIIPDDKLNGKGITLLTDRKDRPTITIPIRVVNH